jgi:hemerythrin-like domain-containing protein
MKPTEILIEEHILIQEALDNMACAVEQLEVGERPPVEFFEKAITFTRNFSEEFHHFKEEYLMFGRLAQKKEGELDAQIDALRYQHDRGRDLIAEISNALDGYARNEDASTTTVVESIAAYISMLRRHIHKEDKTFYPLVDTFLSEDDQRYLKEEFFKEDRKSGGSILEDSQKIVEEMRALL